MFFFKRNFLIIFAVLLISFFFSIYFSLYHLTSSIHTTLFTSISNHSDSSSQENEQASTYFGETLVGWFKNPVFLNKIFVQSGIKGAIYAHKQERQNLIIEIDTNNEFNGKILAEDVFKILEKEIEIFNQNSNNAYSIHNLGVSHYPNPLKRTIFILAIVFISLLGISVLILGLETWQGKISLASQIPAQQIISLNSKKTEDLEYLALLSLKSSKPVIFAGLDFDSSDLIVKTALKASEIQPNLILIDGDLKEKKLHQNLGLSEMMKNLKGLTNRIQKEEKLSQFVHKTLDNKLYFLAAGNGEKLILENLASQLEAHKTILIHTNLPQNFALFNLEEFVLILFIKLGKSTLKTYKMLENLKLAQLQIIIIS